MYGIFVAGGALLRRKVGGTLNFVRLAVTIGTSLLSQQAMNALRNLGGGFIVASGTRNASYRLGVWIVPNVGVAGGASEFAVDAGLVARGIYVQAAP